MTSFSQYFSFLAPLILTFFLLDIVEQAINAGLVWLPHQVQLLSAYGQIYRILRTISSWASCYRQVGMILVDQTRRSTLILTSHLVVFGVCFSVLSAALSTTPFVNSISGIPYDSFTGELLRKGLLCMSPFPLIFGVSNFLEGIHLKHKRSFVVSAGLIGQTLFQFFLVWWWKAFGSGLLMKGIKEDAYDTRVIIVPTTLLLLGEIVHTLLLYIALVIAGWHNRDYQSTTSDELPQPNHTQDDSPKSSVSWGQVTKFLWPLALTEFLAQLARATINTFVAMSPNGEYQLAILTICYPIGHFTYSWLNGMKLLVPVFIDPEKSPLMSSRKASESGKERVDRMERQNGSFDQNKVDNIDVSVQNIDHIQSSNKDQEKSTSKPVIDTEVYELRQPLEIQNNPQQNKGQKTVVASIFPYFLKSELANPNISLFWFCVSMLCLSLLISFLIFWTPILDIIIVDWIGLTSAEADAVRSPARAFTLFPFPVILRAFLSGHVIAANMTSLLRWTGPFRFITLIACLVFFPLIGVHGATMGIISLFLSFVVEAVVLLVAIIKSIHQCGYQPHILN